MVISGKKWESIMSRRSVLLATTFYIAIGSLAAVGPASAHGFGFGGFGGGGSFAFRSPSVAYIARAPIQPMSNYDRGRFGHAPSMSSPAAESAGARLQPSRIPTVANSPIGNSPAATPIMRPAQLPPTITSSGNGIQRPSIDAAGIVRPNDSIANQIKDISAAEGRGKLPKSGVNNSVPNVAGPDATIMGQGQTGTGNGPTVPGVKVPNGPTINLPGTQFGQKGPPEVPGFGGATNGPQVNLPGMIDRHGPDDANKKLAELEKSDQQLLNNATKGGVNSLNTSADQAPGERESDRYGESGASAAATGFVNTGRPVQPLVNTGTPVNVSTSKGSDGNGGTLTIVNVTGPNTDRATVVHTTKDGKTTTQTTTSDPKTGEPIGVTKTTTGGDGKNNTPNDDSSNSHDIGALSASSSIARKGQGGGTDNNGTESSGGQSTQLDPGSAQGRKGNGDGTGTHGDNNQVGNDGTLAAGTVLARKDNGDGGGSDTRDGGTSLGAVKVHPGGGNPSQSNLKAAAAMGD